MRELDGYFCFTAKLKKWIRILKNVALDKKLPSPQPESQPRRTRIERARGLSMFSGEHICKGASFHTRSTFSHSQADTVSYLSHRHVGGGAYSTAPPGAYSTASATARSGRGHGRAQGIPIRHMLVPRLREQRVAAWRPGTELMNVSYTPRQSLRPPL